MNSFKYFMPTEMFFGKACILENKNVFSRYGRKAMILTGKISAKKNGSLDDVISALNYNKIEYVIFDEVEENPSLEIFDKAAKFGIDENVDFLVGIGGGSPMDTAKAVSFLIANKNKNSQDLINLENIGGHIPIIEIPTTAGTGSEVTQYAVATIHDKKTKMGILQKTFADVAFIDAKYMLELSPYITSNTAVDALSHIIESYMCTNSNFMNMQFCEMGLRVFRECIPYLLDKKYTLEIREKLLLASSLGGIAIAQTGTSIVHKAGYSLTYYYAIPHGRANGILLKEYLKLFGDNKKVENILNLLGFKCIDDFGKFIKNILDETEDISIDDINKFTDTVMSNPAGLNTHPNELKREDIYNLYFKSLK